MALRDWNKIRDDDSVISFYNSKTNDKLDIYIYKSGYNIAADTLFKVTGYTYEISINDYSVLKDGKLSLKKFGKGKRFNKKITALKFAKEYMSKH